MRYFFTSLWLLSSWHLLSCTHNSAAETNSNSELQPALSTNDSEAIINSSDTDASLATPDEEVVDYAIADYSSFDPSGVLVHFEFNEATLSLTTLKALGKIVEGMKKDPLARISVRGHADQQGEEGYNQALSARRALAIENFLVNHGIDKDRLMAIPLGSHELLEEGNSIKIFKKNRRGDFTINYGPSAFGK